MINPYQTLSVAELAAEPAFQAYVSDGREGAQWDAWQAEDAAFAKTVTTAREHLTRLSAALADPEDLTSTADGLWARIAATTGIATTGPTQATAPQARIVTLPSRSRPAPANLRRRYIGIALAVAAAVLVLFLLLPGASDVYRTGPGEIQVVDLPDGSRATLGPATELRVVDYGDTRALTLVGEAFFEVERGLPFTIATASGKVRVLGTSFSVATFEGLAVACATGRVKVTTSAASAEITPGLAVRTTDGRHLEPYPVPVAEIGGWRSGTVYLQDIRLEDLGEALARYYARPVEIAPGSRGRRLTVDVPLADFPAAVQRLGFVLQTEIDTSGGGLRIR